MSLLPRRFFFEAKAQKAKNMETFQKPDSMSWEDWCDHRRPGWVYECHWYDPPEYGGGGCWGGTHHDHQPVIMKWYWKSPLGKIIPPLYFMWEARWLIVSAILEKLGWYDLLERFGVDTSPEVHRGA